MIIEKVDIRSFGRFQDRQIDFVPGLNIVLGKNEAGKSTLYSVIDHLLFTQAKLKKPELEKTMRRWFPVSGGDTIAGELQAELENGGRVVISKQWGGDPISSLRIEPGGTFSEPAAIAGQVNSFWNSGAGTIRQVCLLNQGRLSGTIPQFRQDKGIIGSLSDILQNSLIESGGISIAGFIDDIQEKLNQCFMTWDRLKDTPKDNRGIENQWKQKVGDVLKAFYNFEELKAELRLVAELDAVLIEKQQKLAEKALELTELADFIQENQETYRSAGDRRALQADLDLAQLQEGQVRNDRRGWEETEKRISETKNDIAVKKEELNQLQEQVKNSAEHTAKWNKVNRFTKTVQLKREYDESLQSLTDMPDIPEQDFQAMKKDYADLREAEAKLFTGTLHASVAAINDLSFTVQSGLEAEEQRDLLAGNVFETGGEGRVRITHRDWEITVSAGGNYKQIEKTFQQAKSDFQERCERFGVRNLEEVEQIRQNRRDAELKSAALKKDFAAELGEDDFTRLRKEIDELGDVAKPEDSNLLQEKYKWANGQLKAASVSLEEFEGEMGKLQEKYTGEDAILDAHADIRTKQKEYVNQLEQLPSIPPAFASPEEFIGVFEVKQQLQQDLQQKIPRIESDIWKLENDLPEKSLQELEDEAEAAKQQYEKAKAEGETLERILRTALAIQEEIKQNPYLEFVQKTEHYLRMTTNDRYRQANKQKGIQEIPIPGEITNEGGDVLTYDQLSGGTQDVFSLSVRLAMADYFLKDKKGFLLLDDPLVDMDPDRQLAAAEAILEAACRYQCIFFTCHPGMCELFLGANIIELKYDEDNENNGK